MSTLIFEHFFRLKKTGYCQEISQLQPIMTQWAQSEPVLRNGLLAVGEAAATCADAQRKLIEDCKSNFTLVYFLFSHSSQVKSDCLLTFCT